jgi:hypothetical protein
MKWHREELETARKQVAEDLKLLKKPVVPREKLIEIFGEESSKLLPEEKQITLDEIERQMMAFFSYLDTQEYIKDYNLEKGSYHQFRQTVDKISAKPPVVTGEKESLYTLFKNMSPFSRALGKKRINLIKDILNNESEIIESVSRNFFLWFTINNNAGDAVNGRPSLKVLYDYSGYFLNTLAGRSYLLRRNPKTRIVTTYYCILILDKANDALLNSNGIDIRPHIKMLQTDINNQIGLVNKEQYLSELEKLNEKYRL